MAPIQRDLQLKVRVTAQELRMLHELAEHLGLTASDVIRQYVRREHAALVARATSTRKPKKK